MNLKTFAVIFAVPFAIGGLLTLLTGSAVFGYSVSAVLGMSALIFLDWYWGYICHPRRTRLGQWLDERLDGRIDFGR